MGIAERKERQKAELRDQILAAARRIVAREGFDGLTMRKIGDAIEYSPGTIYLYFQSREEIAMALCAEGFGKLLVAMEPAARIVDPLARIREIGRRYVQFGIDDPETYRLIFMENTKFVAAALLPESAADPDDPGTRAFDFLAGTVREAMAHGQFAPGDPDAVARVLWTSVHGIVSLHITCGFMLPDVTQTWEAAADAFIRGLRR